MCLQEATHADSVEGQTDGPGDSGPDWGEPGGKTPPRQASLGTSPRPTRVLTHKHAFGQHCASSRPPAPGGEEAEAPDPADEEVSHITSSASPAAHGVSGAEPDLRGFYGADAQGFLGRPGWADEQRQPSVEQGGGCPEAGERKARASEAEPALGARRKKKMSPPCISIDPPTEDEGAARPPVSEGCSTTLRRRTPSCEAPPHRDAPELVDAAGGDPAAKGERRSQAPCRTEHLTVPSFAFEPLDVGGPSGDLFLDSSRGVAPEPRASSSETGAPPESHKTESLMSSGNPLEKGQGLHLKVPQSPPEKAGCSPATLTPGDSVDGPV